MLELGSRVMWRHEFDSTSVVQCNTGIIREIKIQHVPQRNGEPIEFTVYKILFDQGVFKTPSHGQVYELYVDEIGVSKEE